VAAALAAANVPFMVTGSVVSSAQGAPRTTHDVDLVVGASADQAQRLVTALSAIPGGEVHLDAEGALDALASGQMFNLLDLETFDKVDFWPLTDDQWDQERFARRVQRNVLGMELPLPQPEDTILSKLRWSHLAGGSERQMTDALRVYEVQYAHLNFAYLERWATHLGITALLAELRARAAPPDMR
jgi:hypothetical protein